MTPPAGGAQARRIPLGGTSTSRPRRLRLVETPRPRFSSIVVGLTAALLLTIVFGVVAFHTLLVANQSRIDELDRRIASEQDLREQLSLSAAQLAAPQRIVSVAGDELGMLTPEEVVWLEPVVDGGATDE